MLAGSSLWRSSGVQSRRSGRTGFSGRESTWKRGAVKGKQVLVDESVARGQIALQRQREDRADGVVAVEADAAFIGSQNQKEIQRALVACQRGQEAVTQEAIGDKGKAAGFDATDA